MGMIDIEIKGSFGYEHKVFGPADHGHADVVAQAIEWLASEVLPNANCVRSCASRSGCSTTKWVEKEEAMRVWSRKRNRRTEPHEKKKFRVFPVRDPKNLICPRCDRGVSDTSEGRRAHGTSCVRIPENRPKNWGVKGWHE